MFGEARRDPDLVVLEGLHALKHALRFEAQVRCIAVTDPGRVRALAAALAADVVERVAADARVLAGEDFAKLAPQPPATGVIAIARRPPVAIAGLLADPRPAPIVLLEAPTDLGNLGACVRVAAAADVAGVLASGVHDPWDPAALRGSAGLHFALPVAHLDEPALARLGAAAEGRGGRPLVAVDPDGETLHPRELPPRAILAFGSERRGLSAELLARADARVCLPMRPGVSSLNLATSVAALLYGWKLSRESPGWEP
jgi:TrmH family RNA methyltransferase